LHYIFSRESVKNGLRGRIDQNVTNYFVKNMYKETSFDAAFLCGPEEMIQEVSKTLKSNNIAKENIHFELFTVSVDEEATSEIKEGASEITVLLDDEETTFTMQKTDTILAASLRNDLDAPYSCQGGVCSSCLAKVTEGKAVMVKNSILTDSEVEEGLILTCQAHPTTSKITIDFDDV
jgi:ring-1,2-phenylacetyl-CoA epoxidase subunit PaaE